MTPRYIDANETVKIIRKELKRKYPDTRFTAKVSRYSGNNTIDVKWTDGASEAAVEKTLALFDHSGYDTLNPEIEKEKDELMLYHFGDDLGDESIEFDTFIYSARHKTKKFLLKVKGYCFDRFGDKSEHLKIVGDAKDSSFTIEDVEHEYLLRNVIKVVAESDGDRAFDWEAENNAPETPAEPDTVVDIPQDDPPFTSPINTYKAWVQKALDHNRIEEILAYQDWFKEIGAALLQEQYALFVKNCLDNGQFDAIVALEDWSAIK